MRRLALASLLALALLLPAAEAHPAPGPRDYETRLLHDWNDDWGGQIADGHDLVALDLREAYDASLGDALVFRFTMSGGHNADADRPALREVLSLQVNGRPASLELTTSDNRAFSGTFDAVGEPEPALNAQGQPDGGRFTVEGRVALATLHAAPGDVLSSFAVQGYAGAAKADKMPGGYTQGGVEVDTAPPTETAHPAGYARHDYALAGPVRYLQMSVQAPSAPLVPGGEAARLAVVLKNPLAEPQAVSLRAVAPAGVSVQFHPGPEVDLAPGGDAVVHLDLQAANGARDGVVSLEALTELGGRAVAEVPFSVQGAAAPAEEPAAEAPRDDAPPDQQPAEAGPAEAPQVDGVLHAQAEPDPMRVEVRKAKDSPGFEGLALVAAAAAAMGLARRRRA